jgi:hypothetical protein
MNSVHTNPVNPASRRSNRTSRLGVVAPLAFALATSCGPAQPDAAVTDSALGAANGGPSRDTGLPGDPGSKPETGSGKTTGSEAGGKAAVQRWPNSGDYAEWYSGATPDLPYVVGGQVVIQWSDLDKTSGYDWEPLDKALSAVTLPTTLQINATTHPSYVFDKVPYVDILPCSATPTTWPADAEVGDVDPKTGCFRVAMYWHPAFQPIYTNFLAALADHLHKTSDGAKVVALRQNWNAFGTEHLTVPSDYRSASAWTRPPGVSEGSDWSAPTQYAYEGAILDAHVSSFFVGGQAEPPVFVRTSLESEVLSEVSPGGSTYASLFASGKLAWFTTGAEMEPRAGGGGAYSVFLNYSASGETLGLAEPWANAWGIHTGINDHHWASPPQFLYWRLLSDMQLGISFVDCYGDDLDVALQGIYEGQSVSEYQPEFDAAFRFASKYAGYAGRAAAAPGAFIAFRPLDPAVTHYDVADYAEFISLLDPGATTGVDARDGKGVAIAPPYGVEGNTYFSIGPTDQRFGAWARSLSAGAAAELALDSTFRTHENAQLDKIVNVTYLDDVSGHAFAVAAAGQSLTVTLKGTGKWETATLRSTGSFAPSASGADVVVTAKTGKITLHMVEATY